MMSSGKYRARELMKVPSSTTERAQRGGDLVLEAIAKEPTRATRAAGVLHMYPLSAAVVVSLECSEDSHVLNREIVAKKCRGSCGNRARSDDAVQKSLG